MFWAHSAATSTSSVISARRRSRGWRCAPALIRVA